jgi:ketosteroid isomerase-like protein
MATKQPTRQPQSQPRSRPQPQAQAQAQPARESRREVQEFLTRFAHAFTAGDGKQVASMWSVPAIVIDAERSIPITSHEQIAAFFDGSNKQYNERGITDTHPEIVAEDWIGDQLVMVRVRWPYLDASGREVGAEASDYTLRRDPMGRLLICAAVMRGVEPHDPPRARPTA